MPPRPRGVQGLRQGIPVLGITSIVLVLFTLVTIFNGLHTVDEGYVGVYWRGGALMNTLSSPGWNVKLPYITSFAQVQISVQTDRVRNIPCGTKGGVMIHFESIEVVNRLDEDMVLETVRKFGLDYDKLWIFDKIHHEINQFCSSHSLQEVFVDLFDTLDESLATALATDLQTWAPGIQIIATRVTKPKIPDSLRHDYIRMEEEKTKLLISIESQKVIEKKAETEHLKSIIEAEMESEVNAIKMKQKLLEKRTYETLERLEDEINIAREKALTDAKFYRSTKLSDANQLKLTETYIQHETYQRLKETKKVYMGEDLPSYITSAVEGDY